MSAAAAVRSAKSTVLELATTVLPAKSTAFSMIQPTGVFHLGNYLGAVKSWVDIQNQTATAFPNSNDPSVPRLLFGIADLHALTIPKDPKSLRFTRSQAVASMLATGIDPSRCIVFQQSQVPEHTQLYWLLSTVTGMGYLNRMTQWKSKAQLDESTSLTDASESALSKLHLGLFAYPCLQAADILLYKSTYVPVGEDQSQHLELTRHICATFNKKYPGADKKPIFPEPKTIFAPFKKISSLRDPSKKMSKSDPDQTACIYIPDSPARIQKAIRRAVTDSQQGPITYDPVTRQGIANLLEMASGILQTTPQQVLKDIAPKDHKELKDGVAQIIAEGLAPVRTEYERLMKDLDYVDDVARRGSLRAREIAAITMAEVNRAVGLN
ncbi:uncharacterized protein SAPINGB_P000050 [Magnusiomyces paraingens]|uniref:Tryptophan--tRNA ligase, mitochondrial n=1 Tax=Magnusiomyces paraingens TaxID=2606893 RepID=A0A5E8B2I1_9ASCO|nr:uncharacterized protein SAPINGB_P000050 [Saprochaete ingens]VVT43585.1 unnamed protein product [Saprochaete ingens]